MRDNYVPRGGVRGRKVRANEVEQYQILLSDSGLPPIPHSYTVFLTRANGIDASLWTLYGIVDEQEDPVKDILTQNKLVEDRQGTNTIILGDNITEYLCYEWEEKSYTCRYKADFTICGRFTMLSEALRYFISV